MGGKLGALFAVVIGCLVLLLSCGHQTAQEHSLTVLLPDDILSVDPNSDFEAITDSVLFNIYQPLVEPDKDLKLHPVLAQSWENPRPNEWRFHLRENVRFQDGSYLTPQAVKESLETVMRSPNLDTTFFLNAIGEIRYV